MDYQQRERAFRSRAAIALLAGIGALAAAHQASAQAWVVRAQATGRARLDSNYAYCGSSDAQVNCATANGNASGGVAYANGMTTISAQGQAQSVEHPEASASGHITADLATVTIRQFDTDASGFSGTSGWLKDALTFNLANPSAVYEIPFTYSFDGGLSGDVSADGNSHPGLFTQSDFSLGSASVGESQSIGESGPAYFPEAISLNNGANQWVDVTVTPSMFGYTVSGDVLIGGDWGTSLGFQMDATVSCEGGVNIATCDYSHTQVFGFGALPDGVSYTSASGVFLTGTAPQGPGGVPEPASWALMIGGFGLAGAAMRAARRPARAAS